MREPCLSPVRAHEAAERLARTPRGDHAARETAELAVHRAIAAATANLPLAAMLRSVA